MRDNPHGWRFGLLRLQQYTKLMIKLAHRSSLLQVWLRFLADEPKCPACRYDYRKSQFDSYVGDKACQTMASAFGPTPKKPAYGFAIFLQLEQFRQRSIGVSDSRRAISTRPTRIIGANMVSWTVVGASAAGRRTAARRCSRSPKPVAFDSSSSSTSVARRTMAFGIPASSATWMPYDRRRCRARPDAERPPGRLLPARPSDRCAPGAESRPARSARVMGGEERFAAEPGRIVEVFHHRPGNSPDRRGAGAAPISSSTHQTCAMSHG